jgi:predicted DNA-binding protein with PD1-like motif
MIHRLISTAAGPPVAEEVEVLSLLGDVADHDGQAEPHLHAVLGRQDGSAIGGHLLRGEVWPTLGACACRRCSWRPD